MVREGGGGGKKKGWGGGDVERGVREWGGIGRERKKGIRQGPGVLVGGENSKLGFQLDNLPRNSDKRKTEGETRQGRR